MSTLLVNARMQLGFFSEGNHYEQAKLGSCTQMLSDYWKNVFRTYKMNGEVEVDVSFDETRQQEAVFLKIEVKIQAVKIQKIHSVLKILEASIDHYSDLYKYEPFEYSFEN